MEITKTYCDHKSASSDAKSSSFLNIMDIRPNDQCKKRPEVRERCKKSTLRLGARKIDSNAFHNFMLKDDDGTKPSSDDTSENLDIFRNSFSSSCGENRKIPRENVSKEISFSRPGIFHSADESMKKIYQEDTKNYGFIPERVRISKELFYDKNNKDERIELKKGTLGFSCLASKPSSGQLKGEDEKEVFLRELDLLRVAYLNDGLLGIEKPLKPKSKRFSGDFSEEAQKKFGSAKSISSDQFFEDPSREETRADAGHMARFTNCSGISSDMYFNKEPSPGNDYLDLDQVQESVKDGIMKVAGKLGSIANEMFKGIPPDVPYFG